MVDKEKNKVKQRLCFKLWIWKKKGSFYILNNISNHVTLVQFMDSIGNVNHAVIVVKKCTFDSNYEKSLPLTIELLNFICYCYDKEKLSHYLKKCFMLWGMSIPK